MARKSRKNPSPERHCHMVEPPAPHRRKAFIYARISNDSNHAEDSIDNQTAICKEYIADNGFLFGGIFTDLGFSGTDFERPGYLDMLAGILCGYVKCIVVKDLSRIGRTYIEVGELLFDTFVQYGIRFVSVNDHYDSFADDAGKKKLFILFKNLVNHMYSRDLGKKIKSAHEAKKQRGEPAGRAPYGYRKTAKSKRLQIETDEAEIVKMIFDMRLKGESVNSIAKYLNRNGITKKDNIIWRETFISRLLHNETYTGLLIQGKYECNGKKHKLLPKDKWIVHENAHNAIISKEQFKAVTHLMEESTIRHKRSKQKKLPENRYAGKITCTRCGKAAVRSDNRIKEPMLFYYSCRYCTDELKHENGLTKAPRMPLKKLDAIVMATLRKYMDALIQLDDIPKMLSETDMIREKKAHIEREKIKYKKRLNDAEITLTTAYTHNLSGLIDIRGYELARAKAEQDKHEAETRLSHISALQKGYDVKRLLEISELVKYSACHNCEIPSRELIQTFICRISLTPLSNDVYILLNFEDCFKEMWLLMQESGVAVNV